MLQFFSASLKVGQTLQKIAEKQGKKGKTCKYGRNKTINYRKLTKFGVSGKCFACSVSALYLFPAEN